MTTRTTTVSLNELDAIEARLKAALRGNRDALEAFLAHADIDIQRMIGTLRLLLDRLGKEGVNHDRTQ